MQLAIMFADISGSTRIYEVTGDIVAEQVVNECLATLSRCAAIFEGRTVKNLGDAILAVFPSAEASVEAAIEMHRTVPEIDLPEYRSMGIPPLDIHTGINSGDVIESQNDIFGDAVNVAARMMSMSKRGQILVTEDIFAALPGRLQDIARPVDKTTVKGKKSVILVYEIVWEQEDATIVEEMPAMHQREAAMHLSLGDATIKAGAFNPMVTIGRKEENDLVIHDKRVSRFHASVEYRQGKFWLHDKSANGTYILFDSSPPLHLRHDKVMLTGSGKLFPGHNTIKEGARSITFRLDV